jgi:hypothetical protein
MEQVIMEYLPTLGIYFYTALFVWLVNAAVAGYNGVATNKDDFWQSVLWPISIATLIGMLIKLIIIKLNKE